MRTIDEWMTELAALPLAESAPDPTDEGLDRLWAAILNDGEGIRAEAHRCVAAVDGTS